MSNELVANKLYVEAFNIIRRVKITLTEEEKIKIDVMCYLSLSKIEAGENQDDVIFKLVNDVLLFSVGLLEYKSVGLLECENVNRRKIMESKKVTLRLPADQAEEIEKICKENNQTITDYIRESLKCRVEADIKLDTTIRLLKMLRRTLNSGPKYAELSKFNRLMHKIKKESDHPIIKDECDKLINDYRDQSLERYILLARRFR